MPSRNAATHSDYVVCRTLGHAWDAIASDGTTRRNGVPFWMRCVRCLTERHDEIELGTGDVVHRRYVYPTEYRHAFDDRFGDDHAPTRSDYRVLLLTEHLERVRHLRAIRSAS